MRQLHQQLPPLRNNVQSNGRQSDKKGVLLLAMGLFCQSKYEAEVNEEEADKDGPLETLDDQAGDPQTIYSRAVR